MDKEFGDRMHLLKQMIFITRKLDEKYGSLAEAFKFFDIDRDGEVSRKEFSKTINKLKVKMEEQDIDMVFDYLDTDNDGNISFTEF